MIARSRLRYKGRREGGSFIALPHAVLQSKNFLGLSPHAVKLFIDLYGQYRGTNNGDLCAAWSIMKPLGWVSKATLQTRLQELEAHGIIVLTRRGGRRRPNLYAVTFQAVDPCSGKLDIGPCPPLGYWRMPIDWSRVSRGDGAAKTKALPHAVNDAALPDGPNLSLAA
jgi:hypothetical protein